MVARVSTVAFEGIEARAVDVQVQVSPGLPAFHVVGLADKADRRVSTLPFGEERRVGIARAIAMRPKFLLMDEPAAGLNDAESEELQRVVAGIAAQGDCGVLFIEHRMPLVFKLCHRIQVLQHGATIALGTPDEIRAHGAVRQAYLGDEAV